MAAKDPASYKVIEVTSNDGKNTVDLRLGVVSFEFFQNILSPVITAKMRVSLTGNVINDQGVYNGLPLRGGEKVRVKIIEQVKNRSGIDLDLYVTSISDVISSSQKETFLLTLSSREAITNEISSVSKKYIGTIKQSVTSILTNILGVSKNKIDVDPTQNQYSFLGNLKKPFKTLTWLATKAVPEESQNNSSSGFVFFQTKSGFKFKSIVNLISQKPKSKFVYSQVQYNSTTFKPTPDLPSLDLKMESYKIDKNQDIIRKLRLGAYSSNRLFFNPNDFSVSGQVFKTKSKNTLGGKKIEDILPKDVITEPSRTFTQVLDVGTIEPDVSKQPNADPKKYLSQSVSGYNILTTQKVEISVPCNTDLDAGDVIDCVFFKSSVKEKGVKDEEISGKYLIQSIVHHFDPEKSVSSMTLARDTFGR